VNDAELRELQRQADQGSLEASVQVLGERTRRGETSRDRLRLAAFLGEPASQELVEERAPSADPQGFVRGLWALELEDPKLRELTGVRIALAAVALVQPLFEEERPNDDRPARMLLATAAWAREPSRETARLTRGRLSERIDSLRFERIQSAIRLTAAAAELAESPSDTSTRRSLFAAASAVELAMELVGPKPVRDAIEAAVYPWLLGRLDPLAPA